jgi:hypothetical protein
MNVFELRQRLVDVYADYTRSFVVIRDERIRDYGGPCGTSPAEGLMELGERDASTRLGSLAVEPYRPRRVRSECKVSATSAQPRVRGSDPHVDLPSLARPLYER